MAEFKFVIKCFTVALLFLVLSQLNAGHRTIEGHIEAALMGSETAIFVNEAAQGGVKLIRDGGQKAKKLYLRWSKSAKKNESDEATHIRRNTDSTEDVLEE